ncbi:G-type lectin S-receptor-like serine/threonine-protein kinase At4g27290 [Andrographis paniculata]|uniref:G-type lectin S-receptor-like serine/threonine-protein kinase At4g27290 n=1 Tax=Andrographis paniculata TaxID=175694 RepID=UPI0021E7C5E9|nr:G-type lectin S-receptor-like serine/threonine-protein kinase At4g27290 [Andrographis paniculata]
MEKYRTKYMAPSPALYFFLTCSSLLLLSHSQNTLLLDDGSFISSPGRTFQMGFFSPAGSQKRFFGIWYSIISSGTVVWVANRDSPLDTTSGALQLSPHGNLQLLNSTNGTSVWSSSIARAAAGVPAAALLESGNLVVKDSNGDYIWQSFDYPSDTALPGMKMGKNFPAGLDRVLTSWKSTGDPAAGSYSFLMDSHGFPQLFLTGGGGAEIFRSGPWNGERFSGASGLKPNPIYTFDFKFDQDEVYYIFNLVNASVFSRLVLSPIGILRRFTWNYKQQEWTTLINAPADNCDYYGLCHGNGICDIGKNPVCSCLERFKPKDPSDWAAADWSSGCVRKAPLNCKSDGFVKYTGVKLPDTRNSWYNKNIDLKECREMCARNCNCTAYSNLDIRGKGSGCLLWFEDLMDMRSFGENGQDIYVRLASSELASSGRRMTVLRVCLSLLGVIFVSGLVVALFMWKKRRAKTKMVQGPQEVTQEGTSGSNSGHPRGDEGEKEDMELPQIELSSVLEATDHFSSQNKIGEGGFGPVYKGMLRGREIAVKRLSKQSTQGLDEFKNEVILIAKLQHRNLVKLLGCCIEDGEKMLIYEYMPNNSLDTFIFDESQRKSLDWPIRFRIINGIARGLLYLHQDSRLRIIHRDLKPSNILLDDVMNPKISDFGMARSFGGNESEANTRRVVGTYGYMSPEYAVDGHFSVKSDVFSFGVLVLEIVAGMRNRGFFHADHHHNLVGHAWILHNEGRPLDLIDPCLSTESSQLSEIMRSIHTGLLCTQKSPEERPSMSNVVLMLGSGGPLPSPKEPGFFTERNVLHGAESWSSKPTESSGNELSISIMEPR